MKRESINTIPTFGSNISSVFTNKYGLGRSFVAFSLLLALVFTESEVYFPLEFFEAGQASKILIPNFFVLMGRGYLQIAIFLACLVLGLVISGYLPQLTGTLHAWIAYSFFTGALMVEGGDQIGQIICILLIPVTLFDKRLNHWGKKEIFHYKRPEWLEYFCYTCLVVIQIQMSIVYFFAVAEKIHVPEWADGSAFYYWFNHNPFGASEPLRSMLSPLVNNPYITPIITWGVMLLEACLFGALFMNRKHKLVMFKLAVGFHFMIIVIHGLWSFFFAMLGGLVIYLLPWDKPVSFNFFKQWKS